MVEAEYGDGAVEGVQGRLNSAKRRVFGGFTRKDARLSMDVRA